MATEGPVSYTLAQLATQVNVRLVSRRIEDPDCVITGVADLTRAERGNISYVRTAAYARHLRQTRASAVILRHEWLADCPVAALVADNPHVTYARVAQVLYPPPRAEPGIHATAVVSPQARVDESATVGPRCVIEAGAELGPSVVLGPGCIIGADCTLGEGDRLLAGVTLGAGTRLGRRVLIQPGAVLGSDGFGYADDNGVWVKIPQVGRVLVGDDVEVGAHTSIDRGALGDTVIEEGVKLDNQIQIAHNVYIGAHTAIAGCVGIAGSARIGRHCTIGGAAGIQGHIEIADHVHITGMTKVTRSITEPGVYTSGTPLLSNSRWLRTSVHYRHLEDLARRLKALEVGQ